MDFCAAREPAMLEHKTLYLSLSLSLSLFSLYLSIPPSCQHINHPLSGCMGVHLAKKPNHPILGGVRWSGILAKWGLILNFSQWGADLDF